MDVSRDESRLGRGRRWATLFLFRPVVGGVDDVGERREPAVVDAWSVATGATDRR